MATKKNSSKSAGTAAVAKGNGASSDADAGDNVDKIRDILFGQQLREFERKFQQIESRLNDDLDALRDELGRQGESMHSFIDSEIGILDGKLKAESDTRQQQLDDLQDELKKTARQLDSRLNELSEQMAEQGREFNQKLLKFKQDLSEELSRSNGSLRERMESGQRELAEAKVDRHVLAEMLTGLAMQLAADDSKS